MGDKKVIIHEESKIQQAFVLRIRWLYPDLILFAIPNGGSRNRSEARIQVLEGVLKGVPDILIAEPNDRCHGLFIEFKTSKGRLQKEQKQVHKALLAKGYNVAICRSVREAIYEVTSHIGG